MIKVTSDQHKLVLSRSGPIAVVNGEALASQMEHVASFAFLEPENPFGPEHLCRQLVVQKILKSPQRKRPITAEGERGEAIHGQMVTVLVPMVVVMPVSMGMAVSVIVAVSMIVAVSSGMPLPMVMAVPVIVAVSVIVALRRVGHLV